MLTRARARAPRARVAHASLRACLQEHGWCLFGLKCRFAHSYEELTTHWQLYEENRFLRQQVQEQLLELAPAPDGIHIDVLVDGSNQACNLICHNKSLQRNFEAFSLVQEFFDKAGEAAAAEYARELKKAGKSVQMKKYVVRGIFFVYKAWRSDPHHKAVLESLEHKHKIIYTPEGMDDDLYPICYALQHETFVATNDNFNDHVNSGFITKAWRDAHLVKSKFVRDGAGGMVWQPNDNLLTLWIKEQMRARDAGAH